MTNLNCETLDYLSSSNPKSMDILKYIFSSQSCAFDKNLLYKCMYFPYCFGLTMGNKGFSEMACENH